MRMQYVRPGIGTIGSPSSQFTQQTGEPSRDITTPDLNTLHERTQIDANSTRKRHTGISQLQPNYCGLKSIFKPLFTRSISSVSDRLEGADSPSNPVALEADAVELVQADPYGADASPLVSLRQLQRFKPFALVSVIFTRIQACVSMPHEIRRKTHDALNQAIYSIIMALLHYNRRGLTNNVLCVVVRATLALQQKITNTICFKLLGNECIILLILFGSILDFGIFNTVLSAYRSSRR